MKKFLFAFLMFGYCTLSALDPNRHVSQYIHEYWTAENGLPQSFILNMIQAPDGYFWVNTQQGLSRFDGINFMNFNRWNTPALERSPGASAFCAQGNSLWIASGGGNLLEKRGALWKTHTLDPVRGTSINAMREDQNGYLWLKSDTRLFRFKDDFCEAVKDFNGNSYSRVYSLQNDSSGRLWISTDAGIFRYDGSRFTKEFPADFLPADVNPVSLLVDSRQNVWISTQDRGLFRYDGKKWQRFSKESGLADSDIRTIYEDRDGNIWIGTFGSGINRISGGTIEVFSTRDGLSNDEVTMFCEDMEGSLWIATKNGLNRLKDANVTSFGKKEGIASEFVWSVYEDSKGTIWLGTIYSGLLMIKDGKVSEFPYNRQLPHKTIRTTHEDQKGNLWIGTVDGLAVLDRGRMKVYGKKEGLSSTTVRVVFEDRKGRMWIGTNGNLFLRQGDSFQPYTFPKEFSRTSIYSMYEDSDGSILIGSGSGLLRITDQGCQRIGPDPGMTSWIMSATRASDGSLVMATTRGLGRLRNNHWTFYSTKEGLADNVCYAVVEDREKNLWVTTIRGICRVNISDLNALDDKRISVLRPEVFNTADGMKSAEGCGGVQTGGFLSSDGKLWFPNFKGAVMIDPTHFRKNSVPPPVVVEKMVADNKVISPDDARLAPGTRSIELHYTALSLIAPQKNQFKYKLETFDKDWIEAGTRRTAYYTNIPPGRYTFRVTGCNNDRIWNQVGASFSFYLKPFFYQTSWFLLLSIAAGLLFAFTVYRIRVNQLRAHEKKLARMVKERTRELAQSNLALQDKTTQLESTNATLAERTSQLEEANMTLERLSNLDGLTGIANRRYFEQFVDLEWKRVTREQKPISFVMADVDFFKLYNDRYGHLSGDDSLKKIAAALNIVNRAGDIVARYGGEEFIAVLPNTEMQGAYHIAEKMRLGVEKLNVSHESSTCSDHITISLGVATAVPRRGSSYEELLLSVDKALYQAKQEGRNCTRMA